MNYSRGNSTLPWSPKAAIARNCGIVALCAHLLLSARSLPESFGQFCTSFSCSLTLVLICLTGCCFAISSWRTESQRGRARFALLLCLVALILPTIMFVAESQELYHAYLYGPPWWKPHRR